MDRIFEAVLAGAKQTAGVLRSDPHAATKRATRDVLVDSIPHWLYVGDTPLHLAAAALRVACVEVLLGAEVDPNAVNRRGATPLHYACDLRPVSRGSVRPTDQATVIELLVRHGAKLDRPDRGGATPLHRAVRARSPAAVGALLALGANADCRLGKGGSSPLHLAAAGTGASGTAVSLEDQLEIIALLRQHGADFEAVDAAGRTPRDRARKEQVAEALTVSPPPAVRPKKPVRRKR